MAFIVDRDREVVVVPLGKCEIISKQVEVWRASYGRGYRLGANQADPAVELQKLVWDKLAPQLENLKAPIGAVPVVLVSPDGPLAGFPLQTLKGNDGKILLEHYMFAHVAVPQHLPTLLKNNPRLVGDPKALLVGGIDYDQGPGPKSRGELVRRFVTLPGTLKEIEAVRTTFERAFRSETVELLRGSAADKPSVVKSLPGKQYVLIGTHGFYLEAPKGEPARTGKRDPVVRWLHPETALDQQSGLRSGLIFAGANWSKTVGAGNAFLTALEVGDLDLERTELVVLSACGTGLGQPQAGEGVFGLQRAFALAGARTVIGSLWNVPDEATQLLMIRFHENLWGCERDGKKVAPMGRARALREAQLWLQKQIATDEKFQKRLRSGLVPEDTPVGPDDPVFAFAWAAFTLAGDWR
ncbi:hypothetical protein FRUB_05307 [Fimbriiglobus ruber]|uniref:CHAT domain-containing protein n=1 Tax=Fimbriiglobus ruber TaxID=1908690 RepID=A0A225DP76_9BACT|nr:hypothetical protein FRUB_05307 [Fimbriiglobus ruber]